jgi:hypothetical protein
MSDEKDFKKKFKKSTEDKVKKSSTKLYPVSNKDIDVIKGDSAYLQSPVINSVKPKPKPSKEAGSNTYAKDNQTAIKKLKA